MQLLPADRSSVLEIGSGDGRFAEQLALAFGDVVAVEPDPNQVEATLARCANRSNVHVVHGDFLTASLPTDHFDAVVALASFHHMPLPDAIARTHEVLKPGGRLIVLGVWTDNRARDLVWNAWSVLVNKRLQRRLGPDAMTAPATFDRTSWRDTRLWCKRNLQRATLKRHALWRYTLVWDKPTA
jgi:SAM-dependent methyltransferase